LDSKKFGRGKSETKGRDDHNPGGEGEELRDEIKSSFLNTGRLGRSFRPVGKKYESETAQGRPAVSPDRKKQFAKKKLLPEKRRIFSKEFAQGRTDNNAAEKKQVRGIRKMTIPKNSGRI